MSKKLTSQAEGALDGRKDTLQNSNYGKSQA